jgi:hypothetical protein
LPALLSALRTGWQRAWQMILIASIPPIPITIAGIVLVVIITITLQQAGGLEVISASQDLQKQLTGTLVVVSSMILLPFLLITFLLNLLCGLAYRACITENKGVIASYRRAWNILRSNFISALLLAILHLTIRTVIHSGLTIPAIFSSFCFAVSPLLWIINGIVQAFFFTLWTLAWREWVESSALPAQNNQPTFL